MIRLRVTIQPGRIDLDKRLLRATMRSAGSEVAAVARQLIRASAGSGRLYRGRRASAPGEPPVGRTGQLAAGLRVKVYKSGEGVTIRDTARSAGGSGAPYALFLEKGARGGVGSFKKGVKGRSNWRIGRDRHAGKVGNRLVMPRPFLTTALQMREASIAQRVAASINGGLKFVKQRARP